MTRLIFKNYYGEMRTLDVADPALDELLAQLDRKPINDDGGALALLTTPMWEIAGYELMAPPSNAIAITADISEMLAALKHAQATLKAERIFDEEVDAAIAKAEGGAR